jgi:ubiquinone/menaquinone biosynthesis C-methylase UbiE
MLVEEECMSSNEPAVSAGEAWRVWPSMSDYGTLLYRRAIGELPEMESARTAALRMREYVRAGDRILDVGCGAGHYLRSLRRAIDVPFTYLGIDATPGYVDLARRAWSGDEQASFQQGDVFALPFADGEFDLVMSCNLLLHLPSIQRPLAELVRVARRTVLVRTLVGDRSFRILEVRDPLTRQPGGEEEFDDNGEPLGFSYYNIYSTHYVGRLLARQLRVASHRVEPDQEFDAGALDAAQAAQTATNKTRMVGGWQVSGYILLPWQFVHIALRSQEQGE